MTTRTGNPLVVTSRMADRTNPGTNIPLWPWLFPMLVLLLAMPTSYSNTRHVEKLYHGCELSNYTDTIAQRCLQRVTCLWLGGETFNNVTRNISRIPVKELNITKCRRAAVPTSIVLNQQSLAPVSGLIGLHIEDCSVSLIENNTFQRMTSLRFLRLIRAQISELDRSIFSSLLNLEQLDLSSNPIRHLSLELAPKLNSLILGDCLLEDFSIWASIKGVGENLQLSKLDLHASRDSSRKHGNISVVRGLTNLINNASELILDGNNLNFTETFSFAGSKVTNISMLSITVWNSTHLDDIGGALKGKLVEKLVVRKPKSAKSMSYKYVTFDAFEEVDLKELVVEANFHHPNVGPTNPFRKLVNLTGLYLRDCAYDVKYVPSNFTGILKNLEHLSLNYASLDNLRVHGLKSLRTLDLSNNIAGKRNHQLNITEVENLRSLNLSCVNASIQLRIEHCVGFRQLILRNITISEYKVGVNMTLWQTHIPCLKQLDLSSNNADYFPFFTWISNVRDAFLGLEHIEELDLNDTDIGAVDREDLKYVFKPLKGLKRLNLADSLFKHDYPVVIFQNQAELEELDWSSNAITAIGSVVFSTLRRLRSLDLRNNQLIYISGKVFTTLTNLQTLLMWENSFACNCKLRGFTYWLSRSKFVIPKDAICESYSEPCRSPPKHVGHRLESFLPTWLDCENHRAIVALSTSLVLLFCLSVSLSVVAYRKRLSIRYWYVIRKLKRKRERPRPGYIPLSRRHSYDVFIAYMPQEQRWVEHTFRPELEQSKDVAFRVATVDREFQVSGRPEVIDLVEGGFGHSSHVIFIVTDEFLSWEKSDYMMTQAEVMYLEKGCPEPILVLKERITTMDQAPLSYKRLIRHVVRLHWPQGQGYTEDFWKNLRLVLLGELNPSRTKAIYAGY
ncbi:toll-like receptor 2 [Lineus longissimus]|uniref:toll-like receptor 2 n=1 Tax=Lineus longissimus TaxID=88925 RepID=UPI00315D70BD